MNTERIDSPIYVEAVISDLSPCYFSQRLWSHKLNHLVIFLRIYVRFIHMQNSNGAGPSSKSHFGKHKYLEFGGLGHD